MSEFYGLSETVRVNRYISRIFGELNHAVTSGKDSDMFIIFVHDVVGVSIKSELNNFEVMFAGDYGNREHLLTDLDTIYSDVKDRYKKVRFMTTNLFMYKYILDKYKCNTMLFMDTVGTSKECKYLSTDKYLNSEVSCSISVDHSRRIRMLIPAGVAAFNYALDNLVEDSSAEKVIYFYEDSKDIVKNREDIICIDIKSDFSNSLNGIDVKNCIYVLESDKLSISGVIKFMSELSEDEYGYYILQSLNTSIYFNQTIDGLEESGHTYKDISNEVSSMLDKGAYVIIHDNVIRKDIVDEANKNNYNVSSVCNVKNLVELVNDLKFYGIVNVAVISMSKYHESIKQFCDDNSIEFKFIATSNKVEQAVREEKSSNKPVITEKKEVEVSTSSNEISLFVGALVSLGVPVAISKETYNKQIELNVNVTKALQRIIDRNSLSDVDVTRKELVDKCNEIFQDSSITDVLYESLVNLSFKEDKKAQVISLSSRLKSKS